MSEIEGVDPGAKKGKKEAAKEDEEPEKKEKKKKEKTENVDQLDDEQLDLNSEEICKYHNQQLLPESYSRFL